MRVGVKFVNENGYSTYFGSLEKKKDGKKSGSEPLREDLQPRAKAANRQKHSAGQIKELAQEMTSWVVLR